MEHEGSKPGDCLTGDTVYRRVRRDPYYMCFTKGCARNRKFVPRDKVESEFAALLEKVTPTQNLVGMVTAMFKDAWDQRVAQAKSFADFFVNEIADFEVGFSSS